MKHTQQSSTTKAIFLCIAGFLFFNWPLVSIAAERNGREALIYLYTAWLVFVAGLWWYSRRTAASLREKNDRERQA